MFEHTDTLAILAALHSLLIKLPVLVGPTSDLSTTTVSRSSALALSAILTA